MTRHELFESRYAPHLDRVSRSFALCIRELEEPLRSWTAIAYLICRLLDTVEDAPWADKQAQQNAFDVLLRALEEQPSEQQSEDFSKRFAPPYVGPLTHGEQLLLQDCHNILSGLHALPEGPRQSIVRGAQRMASGMRYYAHAWHEGSIRLIDLEDVNRYCYFVAGIVGEMLTRLFAISDARFVQQPSLWQDAQHFGLFLQKVNLLKDQKSDEQEGRFLCPDRGAMMQSLRAHAEGSLRYLTALPQEARAFRIFCAWSMFLGAASLPYIEASHASALPKKITRAQTQALMQTIAAIVCDNAALNKHMADALALMPVSAKMPTTALSPKDAHHQKRRRDFFAALDHAPLQLQDFCALGMLPNIQNVEAKATQA